MTRCRCVDPTYGLEKGMYDVLYRGPAVALSTHGKPTQWLTEKDFGSLLASGYLLDEPFDPIGLEVKVNQNGWFLATHPSFPDCQGEGKTFDEAVIDLRRLGMGKKYAE